MIAQLHGHGQKGRPGGAIHTSVSVVLRSFKRENPLGDQGCTLELGIEGAARHSVVAGYWATVQGKAFADTSCETGPFCAFETRERARACLCPAQ